MTRGEGELVVNRSKIDMTLSEVAKWNRSTQLHLAHALCRGGRRERKLVPFARNSWIVS